MRESGDRGSAKDDPAADPSGLPANYTIRPDGRPDMELRREQLSFWWAVGIELAVLGISVVLAWTIGVPWPGEWRLDFKDCFGGVFATAPLLLVFRWLLRTKFRPMARIRIFVESVLKPWMQGWSIGALAVISILAGLCEEVLFRGVLQDILERSQGRVPAVMMASAAFGVCHWITPGYALVAGLMGLYLGILRCWTGNLLTPMVAHGWYDFIVLLWVLRVRQDVRS